MGWVFIIVFFLYLKLFYGSFFGFFLGAAFSFTIYAGFKTFLPSSGDQYQLIV